ncbi:chitin deacetylase [Echria macrotheca]|uniref:Chitin deacetylase n=1 Tax=Echria macrotheca TaxID=438768 RepID=A0AAJ0B8I3_9PEZI|nr:chitin deacetylase [Echria macrotheca]
MHFTSSAVLVGGLAILPGALATRQHSPLPLAKLAARTDTSGVPRPNLGSVPYGTNVDRCSVPGKAAITFDDGPDIYTAELLDILAKNGVKATFFVTGDNGHSNRAISDPSGPYPGLFKRMHAEGHQIACHSWTHPYFTNISASQRAQEFLKLESVFVDILGFFPTYFRPPYTSFEGIEGDIAHFGYHNINFDLDTQDWKDDLAASRQIVTSTLAAKGPSGKSFLAILHEIHELSVTQLLQFVIDEARKYKYDLVTVGECLGDHPNNWYRDPATGGPWGGPPPPEKEKPKPASSSALSSAEVTTASSSEVKSTTSASESTPKGGSTTTPGVATTTGSAAVVKTSSKVESSTAGAATTTPAAKPNAGARVQGLSWVGGMLLALGAVVWH